MLLSLPFESFSLLNFQAHYKRYQFNHKDFDYHSWFLVGPSLQVLKIKTSQEVGC